MYNRFPTFGIAHVIFNHLHPSPQPHRGHMVKMVKVLIFSEEGWEIAKLHT